MTVNQSGIEPDRITLDSHRKHPEISLERHFRSKFLTTADRVLARKRIYLDTRFWVLLREVCLGRSTDQQHKQILTQLRRLVAEGKVICPINADILAELLKQRDETTRLATAKLIDELSLGTALQSEDERVGTELMHCVKLALFGPAPLEPLERLVWTSPSYVLGSTVLWLKGLPEEELLAWQKAFTDYLWDVSLANQISSLREIPEELNGRYKTIANTLNHETRKHDLKVLPLTDLHVHEFKGMLGVYAPKLAEIFVHLHGKGTSTAPPDDGSRSAEGFAGDLIRSLAEALRKGTLGRQLPSLIIKSGLHAAVRRNRGKQLTGNDLHDFGHATAALGYCNYFATDKPLRHLIVNDLRFDQRYNTAVVAEASEFLVLLDQI